MNKHFYKISILLLIISTVLLLSAFFYYDLVSQIKNYKYIDIEEYDDVNSGLEYLFQLPIQFNITNKYFSNMNHLKQEEKEEIVMAYAVKNKYSLYDCGPTNSITSYLCINKDSLNSKELLNKFGLKMEFLAEDIKIYIDDYGVYTMNYDSSNNSYKLILDNTLNNSYRLYSKFDHYIKDKNMYIFYLYQGYFKGNCTNGEKIDLYDFMTGKAVYTGVCSDKGKFVGNNKDFSKLQLYKYELKKHKDGRFYIYGYNPVKNVE